MRFRSRPHMLGRYYVRSHGKVYQNAELSLTCCVAAACSALVCADDERVLASSLLNWLNSASGGNAGAGYIYGVVDTIKAQHTSARINDVIWLPANMEEAQIADIMRRFLSQNPALERAGQRDRAGSAHGSAAMQFKNLECHLASSILILIDA
jgi:hypothetical protein